MNTPSPAAGGGPAAARLKKALPGLTAERLAELSCSLSQSAQEDAATLVNRAIEMWNQSRLAMCGSDDEREQLLKTLNPVFEGKEFISFEQLASHGEVPSRSKKGAIRSAKGVEKATLHYLEILLRGCDQAFRRHLIAADGVGQWKSSLENLEQRCRSEKGLPLCALKSLQGFQSALRGNLAHVTTASEIAVVLDLSAELPRMLQIDQNVRSSKAVVKMVKKEV